MGEVHYLNYQNSPAEIRQERDYDSGKIVARTRVARSTIEIMASRGNLTPSQIAAAGDFQRTFSQSILQPRYAKVDFNKVQFAFREWSSAEMDATKRVEQALQSIKPQTKELAWYVIGFQEKLSDYLRRRANMDRPISYSTGRRMLISALDDLVKYYGY